MRLWRWNFWVTWEFTKRVSWVGIWRRNQTEEKSVRKESGEFWRSIRNQSPPAGNSTYSPRTGTSLILCHMVVIEMSKISTIFLRKTIFLPIFWKISWYFLPVQATHKHDAVKFWYFYWFFFWKFPYISYRFRLRTRIQNLSNFFLKKQKILFGNLVMICRQRLCFSTWLKNRGFRVHEI